MAALLMGAVALTGCVLMLAAASVAMVPLVGTAGALGLIGLALLILAAGAYLMRLVLHKGRVPPAPRPQPDPLMQMIFDLSFNLGRTAARRKE